MVALVLEWTTETNDIFHIAAQVLTSILTIFLFAINFLFLAHASTEWMFTSTEANPLTCYENIGVLMMSTIQNSVKVMSYISLFNRSLLQLCWELGNLRVLSEASTSQLCLGHGSLLPWALNFCKYGCSRQCNKGFLMETLVSQSFRSSIVKVWIAPVA